MNKDWIRGVLSGVAPGVVMGSMLPKEGPWLWLTIIVWALAPLVWVLIDGAREIYRNAMSSASGVAEDRPATGGNP